MNLSQTVHALTDLDKIKNERITDVNNFANKMVCKVKSETDSKIKLIEQEYQYQKEKINKELVLGPNDLIATNDHYFNENITVMVTDEGLLWKDGNNILNPKDNISDFVKVIDMTFRFTGVNFDDYRVIDEYRVINYTKIKTGENLKDMTSLDLFQYIYNQPLEHDIRFVCIGDCHCCTAITMLKIKDKQYKTYGELMQLFGQFSNDIIINDKHYYEYPDSVLLVLRHINSLSSITYDGDCKSGQIKPVEQKLDPNIVYLNWYYDR